jgi:hypothetical protein
MQADANTREAFRIVARAEELAHELDAAERAHLAMALVKIALALDSAAAAFSYGRHRFQ